MWLDQIVAPPEKPEQVLEAERKDMLAFEPAPDRFELCNARLRRLRGEVGAVECSCGRADDEIRLFAVLDQRAQHPRLHRTEAATTGKNEGCGHTLPSRFPSCSLQSYLG